MDDVTRWEKIFVKLLSLICTSCMIKAKDIANESKNDITTVRRWLSGERFPRDDSQKFLLEYLPEQAKKQSAYFDFPAFYRKTEAIFADYGLQNIRRFKKNCKNDISLFVQKVLHYCFTSKLEAQNNHTKPNHSKESNSTEPTLQKTRAIVFDFDGTLTTCKANRTTWEDIWTALGYDVEICRDYHKQFDQKIITHEEWCKITEDYFRQKNLNLQILDNIAKEITLMPGIDTFLKEMRKHHIKMYIVSGSIFYIIRKALGSYYLDFDGIKANQFFFNDDDTLQEIAGTAYDFEGKAEYINQLAKELHIEPSSILFVGNSLNDEYAHASGARTLCINPKKTDSSNKTIWHDCIQSCTNLNDILPYIII